LAEFEVKALHLSEGTEDDPEENDRRAEMWTWYQGSYKQLQIWNVKFLRLIKHRLMKMYVET
jgi:hypothetical protein